MKAVMKFLVSTFIAILTGDIIISTIPLLFPKAEHGLGRGWELQLVEKECAGDSSFQYFPFSLAGRIILGVSCALAASLLAWRRVKKEGGECWKCLQDQDVARKRPNDESLQQEVCESGDVRTLLAGPPQLWTLDELSDSSERESRQEEIEQDSLQSPGQESPSFEEQLDPEEPAAQEDSLRDISNPKYEAFSSRASNTSLSNRLAVSYNYHSISRDDQSLSVDSKKIEETILSFEQRLEAVEAGLKDTETITKMWSNRIEQAEGELNSLHKQMYRVLSRTPSEMDEKMKSINDSFDMQDDCNIEALKNISAIIEDTKNQVAQMTPTELSSPDYDQLSSGEDFNPMELPILVRIPSLENIPVKDMGVTTPSKIERTTPPTPRVNKGRPEVTCKVPTRYVSSKKPTYYDSSTYIANKTKTQCTLPKKAKGKTIESTDLVSKYAFLSSIKKRDK